MDLFQPLLLWPCKLRKEACRLFDHEGTRSDELVILSKNSEQVYKLIAFTFCKEFITAVSVVPHCLTDFAASSSLRIS